MNEGLNFVDISLFVLMIVIDCMEVVKDGVLVLYGFDVVVGVVNFIIKCNYDGVMVSFDY